MDRAPRTPAVRRNAVDPCVEGGARTGRRRSSRGRSVVILALALAAGMVTSAPALARQGAALSGRVVDASTGAPVRGAVVVLEGASEGGQVTDDEGRWRLSAVTSGAATVLVSHIGYAPWRGTVTGADQTIRLTPRVVALDEVVITAARRLQRLADVAIATEVISRREIEHSGTSDLSRVLIERLGIQVEGGVGSGEGVMIQGLGSQRVLILLDGQPVVGRVDGMLDVSRLPVSSVERIEVMKGPQSSLYGTDAIGGVVNIVTRGLDGPRWRGGVELTAGTEGRLDGTVSLGGSRDEVGYLVTLGRRATDLTPGRSATAGALAERWDGMLKADWRASPSVTVHASGLWVDDLQRWRTGPLYNFSEGDQWMGRLGADVTIGETRLAPTLYFSEFARLYRQSITPDPVADSGNHELQRLIEGELLYNGTVQGLAVDGGVEGRREYIESERILTHERALHTLEPFAQVTIGGDRLQLVPGARLVWSEQWGTHFTPRLAAFYRPVESVAIRAAAGLGYRAPDFKELGMSFLNVGAGIGYEVRGNPNLLPENSENLTLSVEWGGATRYLRVQGFHNQFDDFIQNVLAGDSAGLQIYSYGNVERGYTRGLETEVGLTHGGLRVEGGYSWLRAHDRDLDRPLLGRPARSGRLMVEHPLPLSSRLAFTASYTGTTPMEHGETGDRYRPAFTRLDLRLSSTLPRGVRISAGVHNLLDEVPEEWPGYGRRQLYLGLNWSLPEGAF